MESQNLNSKLDFDYWLDKLNINEAAEKPTPALHISYLTVLYDTFRIKTNDLLFYIFMTLYVRIYRLFTVAYNHFFIQYSTTFPLTNKTNVNSKTSDYIFTLSELELRNTPFLREQILESDSHISVCDQLPSWRSWLARQSHNLKVVSSSLTEGIYFWSPKTYFKKKVFRNLFRINCQRDLNPLIVLLYCILFVGIR